MMVNVYEHAVKTITGEETTLGCFRGKTLLIVNVASECGLTPQYSGLQNLYNQYSSRGLCVIGFPCNQFGSQEPGSEEEIKSFCTTNYNITFPMYSKIEVNGNKRHPLYTQLVGNGKDISWNFEKFLVSKDSLLIQRFSPKTTPEDPILIQAIEENID
jgi:glutathione peroxidase